MPKQQARDLWFRASGSAENYGFTGNDAGLNANQLILLIFMVHPA
jgi:hypothetical protein